MNAEIEKIAWRVATLREKFCRANGEIRETGDRYKPDRSIRAT
jgi:hypothetical protein